jgi:sugar lactone lactonase YvrE
VLPDGKTLLFADRPANAIRVYDIDEGGGLIEIGRTPAPSPVYIELVEDA